MAAAETSSYLAFALLTSAMTICENGDRAVVVPILDDTLEDVRVGTNGHVLEKVSGDGLAPHRQPTRGDLFLGAIHRMRLVEDNPVQMGIRLQNADQQRAVPAADINNRAERGEIVRGHHRHCIESRDISHGRVEGRVIFRTPRWVFERIVKPSFAKHRSSRSHTVFELLPIIAHPLAGVEHDHRTHTSRDPLP